MGLTQYNWMSDDEVVNEAQHLLALHSSAVPPTLAAMLEELTLRLVHAIELEEHLDDYLTVLETADIGLKRAAQTAGGGLRDDA
jgi:hypothetical protein